MDVAQKQAKKRVLYYITKSNWGGAQRYVYDMARAAAEAGHEVLVAAGGAGELRTRLENDSLPFREVRGLSREVHGLGELVAFGDTLKIIHSFKPDVMHLNSSKAGMAALAARLLGVRRIIFTVHGWAWNENRPSYQKALISVVYWLTLLLCHRVIAVSEAAKSQGKRLPFVWRKMRVIHNGVHPVSWVSREEARARLVPGSRKAFWVGTIAELHPTKGLDVLIEAYEHFAPDVPDSELAIIGEGDAREDLERQLTVEGVMKTARLVGHVPDAARFLSAFDIFVLPSRSEGLGYVLLEAGLARLPVVATRVGGIPEIIEHEVTGLLVPPNDREALTSALVRLAGDESLRTRLGVALYERVTQAFSLPHMTDATLQLYN